MKWQIIISIFIGIIFFSSCEDNKNNADPFDRKTMLTNYAENLITPSFSELQSKTNTLYQAVELFIQQPDATNLDNAQNTWIEAVKSYQKCNSYNFGPAETNTGTLVQEIATFPVNTVTLEQFITNEDYSLNNFARDTRGFFGIEYLLFNVNNDDNVVINSFIGNDSNKRKEYLKAISLNLKNKVSQVVASWATYKSEFINNDGTAAGSSVSELYNNFLIGFENNKNFKLGLPLGLRAGQTQIEPTKVEAYYSGISKELIQLNFENTIQIFYGRSNEGEDGIGLNDYLKSVEGGDALINETQIQFNKVNDALNSIPDERLSVLITNSNSTLNTAYTEMQNLTRFIKSDMSSLLGISITFSSGDGD